MALVALMTRSGVYQGDLLLETPTGQPMRFLDGLNHPSRLRQLGNRSSPRFELSGAVRRDLHGGTASCGLLVGVRPEELLGAYEVAIEHQPDADAKDSRSYEERQQTRGREGVFLMLANGFRLTAEVGGGLNLIDLAKVGRHFVPCFEVRLLAPGRDTVLELPFMAINALSLEASGLGDPWRG